MSIKLTGREFREFYSANWGGDRYLDEIVLSIDGADQDDDYDVDSIADDAVVVVSHGHICDNLDREFSGDLVPFIRKWLKARSTVTVLTDVPKERAEEFREYVRRFLRG